MKRSLALLFLSLFLLSSCTERQSVTEGLTEFVRAYGAEGIVYSTDFSEGQEGYIDSYLSARLFGNDAADFTYAVFLNTHLDYASECGVFSVGYSERNSAIEICNRRISLLDPAASHSFVRIYPHAVFYSTMQNREKAERLADMIFE